MAENEIRVGDVGTALESIIMENGKPVDISSDPSPTMIFKKPSGESVTKPAAFSTDGRDGRLRYVTEVGFLDEEKDWQRQAIVSITGWSGRSDITTFRVHPNLS